MSTKTGTDTAGDGYGYEKVQQVRRLKPQYVRGRESEDSDPRVTVTDSQRFAKWKVGEVHGRENECNWKLEILEILTDSNTLFSWHFCKSFSNFFSFSTLHQILLS